MNLNLDELAMTDAMRIGLLRAALEGCLLMAKTAAPDSPAWAKAAATIQGVLRETK